MCVLLNGDKVGYLAKRAVATVTIDYGFFAIADNAAEWRRKHERSRPCLYTLTDRAGPHDPSQR